MPGKRRLSSSSSRPRIQATSAASMATPYSSSTRNSRGTSAADAASRVRSSSEAPLERLDPRPQQRHRLGGRDRAEHREAGGERRMLRGRNGDELPRPVGHLAAAGVGDPVRRALGARAGPVRADGLDQAVPLERAHDGVERAPLHVHVVVLALLADRRGDLVAVHRTWASVPSTARPSRFVTGRAFAMLYSFYSYANIRTRVADVHRQRRCRPHDVVECVGDLDDAVRPAAAASDRPARPRGRADGSGARLARRGA